MFLVVQVLSGFAVSWLVASFVEWAAHRAMHRTRWFFHERHRKHHASGGDAQGVYGEAVDYILPTFPLGFLGFIISIPFGAGTLFGAFSFGVCAAFSHQIQHEKPELCFWMKAPIHHLHTIHDQHDANYGIFLDWWDRWLGTYRLDPEESLPHRDDPVRWSEYIDIKWR